MLRKTPWNRAKTSTTAPTPHLKLRLSAQATLIALSALFISACSTPQGAGTGSHKIQSAHSNDIWQRIRNNFAMPELENSEVYARENYYATRADYVSRMATRSGDFLYLIMDEVERRHMPSELALLPFVESAFVTSAKSSAAASGLWQFMPATGRDFSLQQNRFADQRNDVMASTSAALDYLQRLYNTFGDWHLALAAYNWGQGNVNKAVNRSLAAGGSGKYTDLNMPLETRQYVPKLQAIKNIVRTPSMYGLSLPNIPNQLRHEAILVTRDIDVSKAAELANLSEDEFKRINPAYKKPIIVAALNSKILVPADRADDFRRAFSDKNRQLATLTTYTTFSTEALTDIASKYNTDENHLRELNGIPYNHSYVRADSTLIVPRTRKNDEISYLALNSSVRSMSGDVGISDYDTSTLIASGSTTSGSIMPTISSTNITAPGRATTGLVAEASDADQLGTLISNTPSKPAYVPNIPPMATPTVTSAATPTIAPPATPTSVVNTAPVYAIDNAKSDILTMPPVAQTPTTQAPTSPITPEATDPITQLTAANNTVSNTATAANTTVMEAPKVISNNVPNSAAPTPSASGNLMNTASTADTDPIVPDTAVNNLTNNASNPSTPPATGLSATEKAVLATAAVAAVSAPKASATPTNTVVTTSPRTPKTTKPEVKKTVITSKPTTPAKTASVAKPTTKASAAPAPHTTKVSTPPSKPEPKKPESKTALSTTRPTQQNTPKTATTSKITSKPAAPAPTKAAPEATVKTATKKPTEKAQATTKTTVKTTEKPTGKPTSKTTAKPVVKPPLKAVESASKTVVLPKKK